MEAPLLVWGRSCGGRGGACPERSRKNPSARQSSARLAALSVPQLPQPPPRLIQSRILFAERKPHLLRTISRIIVETRSRNCRHTNFLHQMLREGQIIRESKR